MGWQDALMEKAMNQIDLGKLAQEAVAKLDPAALLKQAMAAVKVPDLIKAIMDSFKSEIELLKGDADGDGQQDLEQALGLCQEMEAAAEKLIKLIAKVHEAKAGKNA